MKILTSIAETRAAVHELREARPARLGLVPTMGALHEGHLSLVRAARSACDHVAVSIFVNPTQFGPNEDLARYPRTFAADCALLEEEGVDFVFAPTPAEMFPTGGLSTCVNVGALGDRLDGRSRPGHFQGVATVVSKLFNIVTPDHAFFGQKDAAQVAVLRAMSHDLDIPVTIQVCPTVRDRDGLALSSRNRFLTPEQRALALRLPQALDCARRKLQNGEQDALALKKLLTEYLNIPGLRIDYVEVVDADTLLEQSRIDMRSLIALAAYVGETRLIDNLLARDALRASAA